MDTSIWLIKVGCLLQHIMQPVTAQLGAMGWHRIFMPCGAIPS
jgi:hypothetical protein